MNKVRGIFLDFSEVKMRTQAAAAPKVKMGGWMSVKKEVTFSDRISEKVQKQKDPRTEKVLSKWLSLPIHDQIVTCLPNQNNFYVLASYYLRI